METNTVGFVILLGPAGVGIFPAALAPLAGVVPALRSLDRLDASVLFPAVALPGGSTKGGVGHLPGSRHGAPPRQLLAKAGAWSSKRDDLKSFRRWQGVPRKQEKRGLHPQSPKTSKRSLEVGQM
jgi:hypothetical protein